ncbi:unnamed protein product [Prorocentrum cordatum]|uniref:Uncharacterized protein n=1 Tax=Prorocentrum cordatum TaxID=2364126 RepID=A0ABN9PZG4_9DINO|nr:unnamed protein product [Polarella glacialis]
MGLLVAPEARVLRVSLALLAQGAPAACRADDAEACRQRTLEKAVALVRAGSLSKARQSLASRGLAPGTAETLAELRDPARRPPLPTAALPPAARAISPARSVEQDRRVWTECVRSAPTGPSSSLSGASSELLKLALDEDDALELQAAVAEVHARAEIPVSVARAPGTGRLAAFQRAACARLPALGVSYAVLVPEPHKLPVGMLGLDFGPHMWREFRLWAVARMSGAWLLPVLGVPCLPVAWARCAACSALHVDIAHALCGCPEQTARRAELETRALLPPLSQAGVHLYQLFRDGPPPEQRWHHVLLVARALHDSIGPGGFCHREAA